MCDKLTGRYIHFMVMLIALCCLLVFTNSSSADLVNNGNILVVTGNRMAPSFFEGSRFKLDRVFYDYHSPKRGDVVLIRDETDQNQAFMARIVGLPTERISAKGDVIHINGRPLPLKQVKKIKCNKLKARIPEYRARHKHVTCYEEVLGELSHIVFRNTFFDGSQQAPIDVMKGTFFVAYDNRDYAGVRISKSFVISKELIIGLVRPIDQK